MIDSDGTEASSDDENNRFCGIESAELQAFPCIAGQQFLADWRSGQNGFVFRETFNGFRKLQQTFAADGIHSLFARPGVISDSWMSAGTLHALAARTTGTETKPPLEKTTFGFSFLSSFLLQSSLYDAEWIGKVFGSK